jgi:hypothetical protein
MDALSPGMGVYLLEKDADLGMPAPPEVIGKVCQTVYPLGDRFPFRPVYLHALQRYSSWYRCQNRYNFSVLGLNPRSGAITPGK